MAPYLNMLMKNRPGISQLHNWRHLLAMPTGCQHLWTHHNAPGNFTVGKACESLSHLLSGDRHALKRGKGTCLGRCPARKWCKTGVGPWPGPLIQANPAGSWQEKGPAAAKGCAAISQQDWCQITATRACWGWLPAILPTTATFQCTLTSATLSLCPRQDMETYPPPA